MSRKEERVVATVTFVVAVIALYASSVGFNLSKRPPVSPLNRCINNPRQIDCATIQWAIENHKDTNAIPTWSDLVPYVKNSLKCPSGGTYTLGSTSRMPTCSIRDHNFQ